MLHSPTPHVRLIIFNGREMEALSYCINTSFHSLFLCLQAFLGACAWGMYQSLQMIVRSVPVGWFAPRKSNFLFGFYGAESNYFNELYRTDNC